MVTNWAEKYGLRTDRDHRSISRCGNLNLHTHHVAHARPPEERDSRGSHRARHANLRSTPFRMTNLITKVQGMDRQKLESLFTSSAFLITSGLLFVNLFVLSNALGDSGRGLVAAAYGNTIVLGWAFQIGVPAAAAYFAKDIDHRRVAMSSWAMMLTGAIPIAVLLIPFYLWQLGGETFTEGGPSVQRWYIAFIILQLFNGPFLSGVLWLRGSGNLVRFNALLALPQVLISAGYVVLWILGRLTVNSALTSTFIMVVIGWVVGLAASDSLPGKGFSKDVFKEVRSYGLRAWVGNLSFFVSLRFDQLLLVGFVSAGELGVYAVAAAISTLASPIARGVAQAVQPFIRSAKSDGERVWRIQSSFRQVGVVSFVVLGLMAATAWFIIPFVLGEDFAPAVLLLLILIPGAWATDVTQVLGTALSQFDKPEWASKAQIASAVATAVGLALLVRPYGVVGAAITTSVAYWVGYLSMYYYWRKLQGQIKRGEITGHTEAPASPDETSTIESSADESEMV